MILHIPRLFLETPFIENELLEIRDIPTFYTLVADIVMFAGFLSINASSDNLVKLRQYGASLFGFSVFPGLFTTYPLILLGLFIPDESFQNTYVIIRLFLLVLISSILAIKTMQYSFRVVNRAKSENHSELYRKPT